MVNRQVNRRDKDRGGFVYRGSDPKKLKARADQQGGNFDSMFKNGIDTWKPKQGDNQIRILPPTYEDHEHFGYEIWQHGYVGADKQSYLCREKMLSKRCPICEAAKESRDAGENEEFDQLKAKKRYLYWVIDRDGDVDTPQVWSVAWTMDRDIAELCQIKRSGKILYIDHPDEGYDLMLKRTGQRLKTRYVGLQIDREQSPIDESKKKQREILEYITENPLDEILKFYPEEHLEKAMEGTVAEKDEDLDDDRKSSKRTRVRDDDDDKPRRRARDDDGDEEDRPRRRAKDDDEDDRPKRRSRDDDDDDRPKRKARDDDDDDRPKRKSRDDDDDDDRPKRRSRDDDDDDDKPKRKRRDDDDEDDVRERARGKSRDDDDDDPPKRKRRDDDDEDDKPKRKSRKDDDDEEDDRPSRKGRRGSDDDDDDKPRRRKRDEEDPADDDPEDRGDDDDDKPKRRSRR